MGTGLVGTLLAYFSQGTKHVILLAVPSYIVRATTKGLLQKGYCENGYCV